MRRVKPSNPHTSVSNNKDAQENEPRTRHDRFPGTGPPGGSLTFCNRMQDISLNRKRYH